VALAMFVGLAIEMPVAAGAASPNVALPPPETSASVAQSRTSEIAVLSGGCFWGVQGVVEHVAGVKRVLAGCAGGEESTTTYKQVSTGTTGHAETVEN
jgi:peptide-methionine (S)-S-oxide reductase